MLTKEQLRTLAGLKADVVASIYLPTHEAGREIRQDPIRLKNALSEVENQLKAAGERQSSVDALLEPASRLVDDYEFWRHQGKGLALFLTREGMRFFKLPIPVPELQVVAGRAHLKPLLPLLTRNGRFFVVTVDAEAAKLYEATRFALQPVEIEAPEGVAEIRGETQFPDGRHTPPAAREASPASGTMPKTQAFGETPEEQRKTQLVEYFRRVKRALDDEIGGTQAPVVLCAGPQALGHLKALDNAGLRFEEQAIAKDPEALDPESLRDEAWAIARPNFEKARAEAADLIKSLPAYDAATSSKPDEGGRTPRFAAHDLKDVVKGAAFGRVETLFAQEGKRVWGSFNEASGDVAVEEESHAANEDLTDLAVVNTLLHGGEVHLAAPEDMPGPGPLAAMFRY